MGETMRSQHPLCCLLAAFTVLLILSTPPAPAETDSPDVSTQEVLSEDLSPLRFMLGAWHVDEIHSAGPMGKGGRGKGEMVAKAGPGGHSLILEYRTLEGPMAGFSMLEIFTFEKSKGRFQQAYVTSWSQGLDVVIGEHDEKGFLFDRKIERNGGVFTSRGTIQEITEASFAMESHMGPADGETTRTMRLEFSRPADTSE